MGKPYLHEDEDYKCKKSATSLVSSFETPMSPADLGSPSPSPESPVNSSSGCCDSGTSPSAVSSLVSSPSRLFVRRRRRDMSPKNPVFKPEVEIKAEKKENGTGTGNGVIYQLPGLRRLQALREKERDVAGGE